MGDGRYLDETRPRLPRVRLYRARATATTRVRYPERRHTVQAGETPSSIGF